MVKFINDIDLQLADSPNNIATTFPLTVFQEVSRARAVA